ncbi:MAG: type II secretion system protein [Patescibacteria group bacterium]
MLGVSRLNAKHEKGDTLIEVLFAVTVFSFIVVSALSIMNQGLATSQRALEITLVRQQMDAQAETLRFLHDSYVQAYQSGTTAYEAGTPAAEYNELIQYIKGGDPVSARTAASQFGGVGPCVVPNNASTDFILNPIAATYMSNDMKTGVFTNATTFAQLTYTSGNEINHSEGIWIEAVRSDTGGTNAGSIDFHIRACWAAPGLDMPMNLGTIVRLYEPRG